MSDVFAAAHDDGPVHEKDEPDQRPRLSFDEIAKKYNLPDDEIVRRRILAKLKLRVKGLAKSGLYLRTEHYAIMRSEIDPPTIPNIHGYVLAGNARAKQKMRAKARCAHIAYGFFKRRPYLAIENSCKTPPDWGRVRKLVVEQKGAVEGVVLQQLAEWMDAAKTVTSPTPAH